MSGRRGCDPRTMLRYVVEAYTANSPAAHADARDTAKRVAGARGVRHVRTTFLPSDEVALHVFEATSAEALRQAARLGALAYERIVEAVESEGERR